MVSKPDIPTTPFIIVRRFYFSIFKKKNQVIKIKLLVTKILIIDGIHIIVGRQVKNEVDIDPKAKFEEKFVEQ